MRGSTGVCGGGGRGRLEKEPSHFYRLHPWLLGKMGHCDDPDLRGTRALSRGLPTQHTSP